MRIPRVSVLTVMAATVVVAFDCILIRTLFMRFSFEVGDFLYLIMLALPMANLLAIVAAIRAGSITSRWRFLVGFELAGWLALSGIAASLHWITSRLETVLTTLGVVGWMENSSSRTLLIACVAIPIVFLIPEMVFASVGGFLMWWLGRSRRAEGVDDPSPVRSRLIPLAWLVVLSALPFGAIESYLRVFVDPIHARLKEGSIAVVDFPRKDLFLIPLKGSPIEPYLGKRVRIESDVETCVPEIFAANDGSAEVYRDHRAVKVTILEGERDGESTVLPHFTLLPLDARADPAP